MLNAPQRPKSEWPHKEFPRPHADHGESEAATPRQVTKTKRANLSKGASLLALVPGTGIEPVRWFYPSDGF